MLKVTVVCENTVGTPENLVGEASLYILKKTAGKFYLIQGSRATCWPTRLLWVLT